MLNITNRPTLTAATNDSMHPLDAFTKLSGQAALQQRAYAQLLARAEARLFSPNSSPMPEQLYGVTQQDLRQVLADLGFVREGGHRGSAPASEASWNPAYQEALVGLLLGGKRLLAQVVGMQRRYATRQGPSLQAFKEAWQHSYARGHGRHTLEPHAKAFWADAERIFTTAHTQEAANKEGCFRVHGWLYLAMLVQNYPIEDIKSACNLALKLKPLMHHAASLSPDAATDGFDGASVAHGPVAAGPSQALAVPQAHTAASANAEPRSPRAEASMSEIWVELKPDISPSSQEVDHNGWKLRLAQAQARWLTAAECPEDALEQVQIGSRSGLISRADLRRLIGQPPTPISN